MFQDANLHLDLSIIPRALGDNYRCANLHIGNQLRAGRRHLNESQRAVIAARLVNMTEGRPKTVPIGTVLQPKISLEQAAELLNVGRAMIAAKLVNMPLGGAIYRSKNCRKKITVCKFAHRKSTLSRPPTPEREPAGRHRSEIGKHEADRYTKTIPLRCTNWYIGNQP